MNNIRVAVATRRFDQPLKLALRTATEMNADAVQLDLRDEMRPSELSATGRRQIQHLLEELQIRFGSFTFPTRRSWYDLDHLDARLAAVREAMQFAWEMKCPLLSVRVGRIPTSGDSPERITLTEVLNDMARHGNRVGTTLAVTPLSDSPETLMEIIQTIDQGPIGIDFDPAGFILSGHDPVAAFQLLHEYVVHFQVRDGVKDLDGSGREVPVGRGEVVWDELLALVAQSAYRGALTVIRREGDDPIGDASRAIQFIRRVALE